MAARAALQSLVEEDAGLLAMGLQAVYPTNSVDSPKEDFFAIIQWGPSTPAFKQVGTDRVSIWLHDTDRDYGRINNGLSRIKELLVGTIHHEGTDGIALVTAEWNGESQDLFDGGYETVTRYADFTVVSRYASA